MRRPSRADRDDALRILNSADCGRIALGEEERELLSRFALASMMDGRLSDAECSRAREIIGWYAVLAAAPRMRRTITGRRKRAEAETKVLSPPRPGEIRAMSRRARLRRFTAAWLLAAVSAAIGTAGLLDIGAGQKPVQQAAARSAALRPAAALAQGCLETGGHGAELAALTTEEGGSGGPGDCPANSARQERSPSLPVLLPH